MRDFSTRDFWQEQKSLVEIWCIYTLKKNPKHANYFSDDMSSVFLQREFGALEHGWCCDYPMEGQIFAYMQLPMLILSHVKTAFTQLGGIITKARESMLTLRHWLRIIHRQEQAPACLEFFLKHLCFIHGSCQTGHRCFPNEQVLKPRHQIGHVGFYIV